MDARTGLCGVQPVQDPGLHPHHDQVAVGQPTQPAGLIVGESMDHLSPSSSVEADNGLRPHLGKPERTVMPSRALRVTELGGEPLQGHGTVTVGPLTKRDARGPE
jgi:hypothetical protein